MTHGPRLRTLSSLPVLVRGDPWLYTVARLLLVPLAHLYGRFEVTGAGQLPSSGPALIVANHPSDLDPILVALPFRRTLRFMTHDVQFERPFVGWCMRRLGAFAVDRDRLGREGLRTALELLDRGQVVAIFPEGDVYAGQTHPFEAGAAFLAEKSGARVIPVGITGAEGVLKGHWWRELPGGWRRRPRVRVTVGVPVFLTSASPHDYHEVSARLGELIARLRAA